MVDKFDKSAAFEATKRANYIASMRLEGMKVEAAPHPDNHGRHEVTSLKVKYMDDVYSAIIKTGYEEVKEVE